MKSIQVNFIYGSERDIRFFMGRFNLEPQINTTIYVSEMLRVGAKKGSKMSKKDLVFTPGFSRWILKSPKM